LQGVAGGLIESGVLGSDCGRPPLPSLAEEGIHEMESL